MLRDDCLRALLSGVAGPLRRSMRHSLRRSSRRGPRGRGGPGLAVVLIMVWAICAPAIAQEDVSIPSSAVIADLSASLASDTTLTEEQRATLSERLNGATRDIEIAAQTAEELKSLRNRLERSDEIINDYERRAADIESAPATLRGRLGANPELAAIEGEITVVESQRQKWARDRTEALDAMANLATSDAELRRRLAELNAATGQEPAAPAGDQPALSASVSSVAIEALQARQALERGLIEARLRGGAQLNAIRTAKLRWLDEAVSEADTLLIELREAAAASRKSAGDQRRAETRRLLARLSGPRPELTDFAGANLELIDDFQAVNRQIESARRDLARIRQMSEGVKQDSQLTQRRLEVAGLGAELGDVMLSRLGSLPTVSVLLAGNRDRNEQIAEVSSGAIDTEQQLRSLSDRHAFLAETLGPREDWSATERAVTERLLEQRRALTSEQLQAQNTLLRLLVDENQATEELAQATETYRDLLTGNLLWVRNYSFARLDSLRRQLASVADLPGVAETVGRWPRLVENLYFVLGTAVLILVLLRRHKVVGALEAMLGRPIRPRDESATLILKALALTLIASLAFPLTLVIAGAALTILGQDNLSLTTIGKALLSAGVVLYVLNALRRMLGRLGVGRRLLKWNSQRADLMLQNLNWFTPTFTIAAALQVYGRQIAPTESGGVLGALSSLVMTGSLLLAIRDMRRSELFDGDRLLRYALSIALLLNLGILLMHLSGQLFAAHLYLRAFVLSIAAMITTLLIANVLQRILVIHRMGLERKTREERRAKEEKQDGDMGPAEDEGALEAVSSLSEAYTQLLGLLRLFTLGALLWLIWSPALPALTILDTVTLWSTVDPALPPGELREITLSVVLFALIIVATTLLMTKHAPPLLNVLLMEWTAVSAGGRYAAGMLTQYLIIGVGLSSALVMLGFQWSKVQWLVAALGVGIGFGLQEIVANFISGLIVLFERPIRVGDIINAGGHDGTVVNINPRATVIETFEGKEVMIPNKELITNIVTNWSLSSSKLRIVVPVGIAYGSDVEDAIERLLRIARSDADILTDPEPFVTFEDFGDNALVLWLRCYALQDYLLIATRLRREIYRDFNAAGIGIAFPQRDVHLDASDPLPIRILREEEPPPAAPRQAD